MKPAAPPPLPVCDPEAGARLGPFELCERIARGGMADVFRAVPAVGPRRMLAVKRLRAERAASPACVRRFHDEARVTALLDHPNVVRVGALGADGGDWFLAMEYLPGKNLATVLCALRAVGRAVPPAIAARIACDVARGLEHAHGHGLVHRDVTPSNIMILPDGRVKLIDFGIASAAGDAGAGDELEGKLAYMAPEAVRGDAVDARADLFTLGVVLWELLVGARLPAAAPPPSSRRPEVPAALDAVVARALAPEPSHRFGSAAELAAALAPFAAGEDALAGLLAELGRPGRARARRRRSSFGLALVAATIIALLAAPSPVSTAAPQSSSARSVSTSR